MVQKEKLLSVKNLKVSLDREIIKGVSFDVNKGETLVILGPNGSGKSTIAKALAGFPGLNIEGSATFKEEDLLALNPSLRSRKGLFLSFQSPVEIPGVSVSNFIRTAINSRRAKDNPMNVREFVSSLNDALDSLNIPREFSHRELNRGFSGGEKKKAEMLQLLMLKPDLAILDETDSGLDVDALKNICNQINVLKQKNKDLSLIIITHYKRMLDYLQADKVIVLKDGEFVKEGGEELVCEIEEKGFEGF